MEKIENSIVKFDYIGNKFQFIGQTRAPQKACHCDCARRRVHASNRRRRLLASRRRATPDVARNEGMIATGNHDDCRFAARSTIPGRGLPHLMGCRQWNNLTAGDSHGPKGPRNDMVFGTHPFHRYDSINANLHLPIQKTGSQPTRLKL